MRLGVQHLVARLSSIQNIGIDGHISHAEPKKKRPAPHNKGKKWTAAQHRAFSRTMKKKWAAKRAAAAQAEE